MKQWNKTISLVQERTLDDFFIRHIIDSLQIANLLPAANLKIVDIGTGAGFPGMALAMCGYNNISLVESNRKKCIFLNEVCLKAKTSVEIFNERAENINGKYDFILSRACSSLTNLLSLMNNVSRETSTGIFHKGSTFLIEIEEARLKWDFDYELKNSITDKSSKIIIVKNVGRKYG
ncbi:MAG: 16S rRNA (guanine(527)-N(7))-methyltransferase RsmG [Alphaproteobacteria bacterium]|nr:16S rRNA (guanine(527)-N(7))-methyltransferase RsmG [Alphaproteobacteria bacterium]